MSTVQLQISHPIDQTDKGPLIQAYGAHWPLMDDLSLELLCYRINHRKLGWEHLMRAWAVAWPEDLVEGNHLWHYWTERRIKAHCAGYKVITWAGGGSIGKSNDAAKLGTLFYTADPINRRVVCCSTTLDMADARVWGLVKREYLELQKRFPHLIVGDVKQKPPSVMHDFRDSINCMRAAALQQGDEDKTLSNVIGVHPKGGYLLIVDEATDVAPGFIGSFGNLEKGTAFFQCIAIGNSNKKSDPHGVLSTPVAGWASINPDIDDQWETRFGTCLYFDCYRSPAIYEKNPDRRKHLARWFPTLETIKKAAQEKGEKSMEFWRMDRGFWPPDDIDRTVLNAQVAKQKECAIAPEWSGNKLIQLVGQDPAYTSDGDDCIVRQATLGEDIYGRRLLDFGGPNNIYKLPIVAGGGDPYYQIAEKYKHYCERRGISTTHVAVETGGINLGLSGILDKEWAPGILKVSFNGSPTDRVVDSRGATAKEVYSNRVTELWFQLRRFIDAGQIRGLDEDTLFQLYSRRYNSDDNKIYKKIELEPKASYKNRMKKINPKYGSPDLADAAVIVLELAVVRFGFAIEQTDLLNKKVRSRELSEEEKSGLYNDPDRYQALRAAATENPLEMPNPKRRPRVYSRPFSSQAKVAWPTRSR